MIYLVNTLVMLFSFSSPIDMDLMASPGQSKIVESEVVWERLSWTLVAMLRMMLGLCILV